MGLPGSSGSNTVVDRREGPVVASNTAREGYSYSYVLPLAGRPQDPPHRSRPVPTVVVRERRGSRSKRLGCVKKFQYPKGLVLEKQRLAPAFRFRIAPRLVDLVLVLVRLAVRIRSVQYRVVLCCVDVPYAMRLSTIS
uniref:Uncharacterized protein n=1 Tax=Pseudo-nitzschia australis TaxID=44445 RepID=A0A6V0BDN7_9STRA